MTLPRTSVALPTGTIRVPDLGAALGPRLPRLPHVLRLLAENHLRAGGGAGALVAALDGWLGGARPAFEFGFRPDRLLMHDTTCTPALVDLAALRDAVAEAGGDPAALEPVLPVDVSVDHSVAVDVHARADALSFNMAREALRNAERYRFLEWASRSMRGLTVHPPGTGIMHTLNLEQFAQVLMEGEAGEAHPETMLGTDSHTPMINGIGVLAWGIGGLEAQSVMLGTSPSLAFPMVTGVRLTGRLPAGTLSTDLALEVTHRLRRFGVAGSFVEFFGEGVAGLEADARATVANMAPEYGAATGFFPVDAAVPRYLARTGRGGALVRSVEPAFRAMGLWFDPRAVPHFDRVIEIDLGALSPAIAGPRRPQDRHWAAHARRATEAAIKRPLAPAPEDGGVPDGAVGIAALTSCTNTSDPRLLVMAGLLARKARALGLKPPPWVKTSLAPGSPSARALLRRAGLEDDLAALGFDIVGFGCTTCIGNSGPLPEAIEAALEDDKAVAAVLSGNRNFPGRVHPRLDLAFLASPPLVVAFALRGDVRGDILRDPLGTGPWGEAVTLPMLWPDAAAVEATLAGAVRTDDVPGAFARAGRSRDWAALAAPDSPTFPWDPASRVLRRPPFASAGGGERPDSYAAAPLMVLGDDVTTDHISPAGGIDPNGAAGRWLVERGADPDDLNVYAAYRGNWEVMVRGLFTNRLVRNRLADDLPPGTTLGDDGAVRPLHEAGAAHAERGVATVLLAGERYGMGSSRDWAAKGVALLGTRAVLARSFERIHRNNLIGMGIVPLRIEGDFIPENAGITPRDRFGIALVPGDDLVDRPCPVTWLRADGSVRSLRTRAAVETCQEADLLRHGGVLPRLLHGRVG